MMLHARSFLKDARQMGTKLVLAALAAPLLVPALSASADVRCIDHRVPGVPGGTAYAQGKTRAGQPCQIGFGLLGADVEALHIIVRPLHGVLGISEKEANRRYVAYAPATGFVGHDRFEVFVQYRPPGRAPLTTRFNVEMNVTP